MLFYFIKPIQFQNVFNIVSSALYIWPMLLHEKLSMVTMKIFLYGTMNDTMNCLIRSRQYPNTCHYVILQSRYCSMFCFKNVCGASVLRSGYNLHEYVIEGFQLVVNRKKEAISSYLR